MVATKKKPLLHPEVTASPALLWDFSGHDFILLTYCRQKQRFTEYCLTNRKSVPASQLGSWFDIEFQHYKRVSLIKVDQIDEVLPTRCVEGAVQFCLPANLEYSDEYKDEFLYTISLGKVMLTNSKGGGPKSPQIWCKLRTTDWWMDPVFVEVEGKEMQAKNERTNSGQSSSRQSVEVPLQEKPEERKTTPPNPIFHLPNSHKVKFIKFPPDTDDNSESEDEGGPLTSLDKSVPAKNNNHPNGLGNAPSLGRELFLRDVETKVKRGAGSFGFVPANPNRISWVRDEDGTQAEVQTRKGQCLVEGRRPAQYQENAIAAQPMPPINRFGVGTPVSIDSDIDIGLDPFDSHNPESAKKGPRRVARKQVPDIDDDDVDPDFGIGFEDEENDFIPPPRRPFFKGPFRPTNGTRLTEETKQENAELDKEVCTLMDDPRCCAMNSKAIVVRRIDSKLFSACPIGSGERFIGEMVLESREPIPLGQWIRFDQRNVNFSKLERKYFDFCDPVYATIPVPGKIVVEAEIVLPKQPDGEIVSKLLADPRQDTEHATHPMIRYIRDDLGLISWDMIGTRWATLQYNQDDWDVSKAYWNIMHIRGSDYNPSEKPGKQKRFVEGLF